MIITNIKTRVLFAPFPEAIADAARVIAGRDVLIVEVVTDEGYVGTGILTGLGVAYGSEIHIIDSVITQSLKPMLIGKDPLLINDLWSIMYKGTTRFGRRGAVLRAISGVDIALWDLLGKVAGMPVYRILGGKSGKVKVYATGGFYNQDHDLEKLTKEMEDYLDEGFTAVKMKVGKNPNTDVERVRVVRETIGPDIDLLIDANEAWDWNTALRFANRIQQYDIYWMEEPVAPDDMEGYIKLNEKSPIPIAAGENGYTKYEFKDMIARNAVSVVQPDVTRVGGITEWMKVAHMAEAFGMPCVSHAVSEVHVSCIAAAPNAPMMEYFTHKQYLQTFMTELFVEPEGVRQMKDGYVYCSEKPGLGIEMDPDLLSKYTVKTTE